MHEMSVAASMLDVIEREVGGVRHLAAATATVGPFAGINADALTFAFTEVADERGFGRPELTVREVPVEATCAGCGGSYPMQSAFEVCPACGSLDRTLGECVELTLDSVEILEETDA